MGSSNFNVCGKLGNTTTLIRGNSKKITGVLVGIKQQQQRRRQRRSDLQHREEEKKQEEEAV